MRLYSFVDFGEMPDYQSKKEFNMKCHENICKHLGVPGSGGSAVV